MFTKEILEPIVENAQKEGMKLMIVIDALQSNGGYSASSMYYQISAREISLFDSYIEFCPLYYNKYDKENVIDTPSIERISTLSSFHSYPIATIPYDSIKMVCRY